MMALLGIFTMGVLTIGLSLLVMALSGNKKVKQGLRILWQGFQEALKGSGVAPVRPRYPVELYKWETMDDEDVCEDCLERATWPPMDIADWMKEGLPGTPEAETECGHECRCRLIRYKPGVFNQDIFKI